MGKSGIHPIQRIIGALRVQSYGHSSDAVDEVVETSETSMAKTVKIFCASVLEAFGDEYLREPNEEDLRRILAINESRGFPGCLGSLNCQHWEWKNCPVAWAGQFKGKEKKPTVVMEAIADGELWIWQLSVGHPGSMNDLNVADNSKTISRLLSGEFPPRIPFTINGRARTLPYYLVDGIYPSWAVFVKSAKGATSAKTKAFSAQQRQ